MTTEIAEEKPIAKPKTDSDVLVEVENLKKYFPIKQGILKKAVGNVKAVDDVSFTIRKGETFGLVGESGSGKSTLGRTMLRLQEPTDGKVLFEGQDLGTLSVKKLREIRREMQIIFQDPFGSLNPRFTIGEIIGEMFKVHHIGTGKEREDKVRELLELVGIDPNRIHYYPHEFSGGQRQRVGIARAIALNPKFILADEAVSALDVSVQAQVINLLKDLQDKLDLTYLFIAHGLNVVRYISTRVGVMYLGSLVEVAETDELFTHPAHPYTQALISTNPVPNPYKRKSPILLKGEIPSPANPPSGCKFHTRCPLATERCKKEVPLLREVGSGHLAACHYPL
ncbi:ABC transporter ATP-binding protein [Bacillus sp. B-jedd]|uniref:ABC transporter ATP-binding protein n=1 Tax=Bacillus sp. B-jedd TaxID=1476857 RepID=UPI0005156493|nr:oligopeptide/dipeptide ABC transporter ATP-binding protein [Bacillus sp. B-jedd]CEG28713.1 oligopeptide/dipeptide ABC transporter ATPase [Bacillus sp. B-jedd]